jgi:hypothetical protein
MIGSYKSCLEIKRYGFRQGELSVGSLGVGPTLIGELREALLKAKK